MMIKISLLLLQLRLLPDQTAVGGGTPLLCCLSKYVPAAYQVSRDPRHIRTLRGEARLALATALKQHCQ